MTCEVETNPVESIHALLDHLDTFVDAMYIDAYSSDQTDFLRAMTKEIHRLIEKREQFQEGVKACRLGIEAAIRGQQEKLSQLRKDCKHPFIVRGTFRCGGGSGEYTTTVECPDCGYYNTES